MVVSKVRLPTVISGITRDHRGMPDLTLGYIGMLTMDMFEVVQRLTEFTRYLARMPFVFLTALGDRDMGHPLSADDCFSKSIDFDRLVHFIRSRIARIAYTGFPPKTSMLNQCEMSILTSVVRDGTSAEIARQLHVSRRKVGFHINNTQIRLGADTGSEAVFKASALGLTSRNSGRIDDVRARSVRHT